MLLLYAPDADEAEEARRWAELSLWYEVTDSLREAGLLVRNSPLHPVTMATTVRVRGEEAELTDAIPSSWGGEGVCRRRQYLSHLKAVPPAEPLRVPLIASNRGRRGAARCS
jgi:hypothetical protein